VPGSRTCGAHSACTGESQGWLSAARLSSNAQTLQRQFCAKQHNNYSDKLRVGDLETTSSHKRRARRNLGTAVSEQIPPGLGVCKRGGIFALLSKKLQMLHSALRLKAHSRPTSPPHALALLWTLASSRGTCDNYPPLETASPALILANDRRKNSWLHAGQSVAQGKPVGTPRCHQDNVRCHWTDVGSLEVVSHQRQCSADEGAGSSEEGSSEEDVYMRKAGMGFLPLGPPRLNSSSSIQHPAHTNINYG